MKTCRRCCDTKPAEQFTKDAARKDGLAVYCNPCKRSIQAAWYEARYGSTHPRKKMSALSADERFAASYKVAETGCWIWQGAPRGSNSYGCLKVDGVAEAAHRYSYTKHVGEVPQGLFVLHRCDTPLCVNPDHLFLGTNQDNSDDKVQKGRQAQGAALATSQATNRARGENAAHKLSEAQVLEIFLCSSSQRRIAEAFNVTQAAISSIKTQRTWKWLTNNA